MRNYSKTVGALAVASMMVGHAGAEIEGQLGAGYHTDYIFRGAHVGDDLVDAYADVAWNMGAFALSAGAWYGSVQDSVGFSDENADELRVYAEGATALGAGFEGRVGAIYYERKQFGGTNDATEVYFGLSHELPFYGMTADLTYYWDVDGDNDGYLELGLNKNVVINECWSADLGAQVGYLVEQGGFSHVTAKAALNYHLTKNATLTGYVAQTWELDELEGSANLASASEGNRFFGGLGVKVGF